MMHVWFIGRMGHFAKIANKDNVRLLFLLHGFFCSVGILGKGFWCLIFGHFWIGRARHPGPTSLPRRVGVEVLNVRGLSIG